MKKSDLKDGMIIELRNIEGGLGVVINNLILFKDAYYCLDNFTENLENTYLKDLDVIKVYVLNAHVTMNEILSGKKELLKVIWERKKEIDWSKVPKWTKVQYERNGAWINCYHINYDEQSNYWPCECTVRDEFTFKTEKYIECVNEKNYRIHPSITIPEEWYKEC